MNESSITQNMDNLISHNSIRLTAINIFSKIKLRHKWLVPFYFIANARNHFRLLAILTNSPMSRVVKHSPEICYRYLRTTYLAQTFTISQKLKIAINHYKFIG